MLNQFFAPSPMLDNFLTVPILLPAVIFAMVASITPGPNNMMLLASGVNFGIRRTIPHLLGITVGFFLLLLVVGSGLGFIFQTYPLLQLFLMIISTLYLLWLAWHIAFQPIAADANSPPTSPRPGSVARPMTHFAAILFQWINPKAWVIAIGYFSDYIPAHINGFALLLAALLFALINLPCVFVWAVLGANLSRWLQSRRKMMWFNRSVGLLLAVSLLPILISLPAAITMTLSQLRY
ncbi:MAG: LysE family translocator [Candidatus Symbiobacter sp.]|nr:LysE family translocator [Candidatus Symbiobacter sp.]